MKALTVDTGNTALDPTWPTWDIVQTAFLEKQKALYGNWTSGYYSIDLYTEMRPPSTDAAYLKNNSQSVVDSIRAVDPQGVWVINGWIFVNDPNDWTTPNIKTWLEDQPNDAILILDLASESMPQWERADNFHGKPWIWNTLLNYGQNYGLYGALEHYNTQLTKARQTGGNLVGAGLTMEGINQNEHLFEMASDAPWRDAQIGVEGWKSDWIRRRYGNMSAAAESAVQQAWTTLDNSVYNSNDLNVKCTTRSVFDLIPSTYGKVDVTGNYLATKITYDVKDVVKALDSLLTAADAQPGLEQVPAFSNDLVDVARQVLMDAGIPWYVDMIAAWKAGDKAKVETLGKRIVEMLVDLDAVLATDKNYLLSTWINDARAWGTTPEEADFMEFQARNQIVVWGPAPYSPWPLDRYAAKHWHGVVKDVFSVSWDMFYKHRESKGDQQRERRLTHSDRDPACQLHVQGVDGQAPGVRAAVGAEEVGRAGWRDGLDCWNSRRCGQGRACQVGPVSLGNKCTKRRTLTNARSDSGRGATVELGQDKCGTTNCKRPHERWL